MGAIVLHWYLFLMSWVENPKSIEFYWNSMLNNFIVYYFIYILNTL